MADIEVLPPKLKVDINTQLRLRVLAGVLYELTEVCGVHIEKDLSKGIVERDVIEEITLSFQDSYKNPYGRIHFLIDWERFELLAKTDDSRELYKGIDFSKGYCNALDKKLLKVLQVHVNRLRKTYHIDTVVCTFHYRKKYLKTAEIHRATQNYMGHVKAEKETFVINKEFTKSLETALQGLDGILHIKFEFD